MFQKILQLIIHQKGVVKFKRIKGLKGLKGVVKIFSVNFNPIDINNILDKHTCLMQKA